LILPGTESTGVEWGACEPEGALGAPLDSSPRCATGAAAAPSACPAVVVGSVGPVPKNAFPLEACSFKYPGGALYGEGIQEVLCEGVEAYLVGLELA
jgi:hypothetical protein